MTLVTMKTQEKREKNNGTQETHEYKSMKTKLRTNTTEYL